MKNINKLIAVIVVLAMTLCPLCAGVCAIPNDLITAYTDESAVSTLELEGATAEYSLNENAARIIATSDGDVTVTFFNESMHGSDGILILRAATSNSANTISMPLNTITKSYSAQKYIFDCPNGSAVSVTFSDMTAGDVVYIYLAAAVLDADNMSDFDADLIDEIYENNFYNDESEIVCPSYDRDKYLEPYWDDDTDIIYNESVFPLLEKDGTMKPKSLMYTADKILSVRNSELTIEYKEGVDYVIDENGDLVILTSGSIKNTKYLQFYSRSARTNPPYQMRDGSCFVYWAEGTTFQVKQIVVTYTHSDKWDGPVPESALSQLPRTAGKLSSGDSLHIVFFGDSITGGGNSSGDVGCQPFAQAWPEMTGDALKDMYPDCDINYTVSSMPGGSMTNGAGEVATYVTPYSPDLVFIEFGINEGMSGDDVEEFKTSLQSIMAEIRESTPDCEFILVSSMLCNEEIFSADKIREQQAYLHTLETTGVVVADITKVHTYMLTLKPYRDMTGNNICHVNDFFARVFSQTFMAMLSADTNGDVNGDGNVNMTDMFVLRQYLAGIVSNDFTAEYADLNLDGKINVIDALMLKFKLLDSTPV